MSKRLRMFAGPNGSGKSTFIKDFPSTDRLTLGVYVNADDIEVELNKTRALNLNSFSISLTQQSLQDYFKTSQFSPVKLGLSDLWKAFSVENNVIMISDAGLLVNSYIAADIADMIRQELLRNGLSFSFETVMSDKRKLDFLELAKQVGYRVYLYYFSTEDPEININRVRIRMAQAGHGVTEELIRKRYKNSLEILKQAVKISDRAFLFDNSGPLTKTILEVEDGAEVTVIDPNEPLPKWVETYLTSI